MTAGLPNSTISTGFVIFDKLLHHFKNYNRTDEMRFIDRDPRYTSKNALLLLDLPS